MPSVHTLPAVLDVDASPATDLHGERRRRLEHAARRADEIADAEQQRREAEARPRVVYQLD